MKKPSWFVPLDLFPLLLPVVCAVYAFIHGFEAKHHTQAGIMLVLVPVLMWGIWGSFMWRRKKFLDSCLWFPTYKLMVQPENYLMPAEFEVDAIVSGVARSWFPFHPMAATLLKANVKWVYFRKDLDEKPILPKVGLVQGLTTGWGAVIYVDYDNRMDMLEKTAFEHELGHVIHGLATGGWDQAEHHAFMKKNHLR